MPILTITQATSRGQITIPKSWRERFNTNNYLLKAGNFKLEITPVDREELKWLGAETIFNADCDNNGQGIEAKQFVKILKSLDRHEQNKQTARAPRAKRPSKNN